jgi:hypothetical protein
METIGDVQERKQPSVFFERVALCGGNNLRNAVAVAGRRFSAGINHFQV